MQRRPPCRVTGIHVQALGIQRVVVENPADRLIIPLLGRTQQGRESTMTVLEDVLAREQHVNEHKIFNGHRKRERSLSVLDLAVDETRDRRLVGRAHPLLAQQAIESGRECARPAW